MHSHLQLALAAVLLAACAPPAQEPAATIEPVRIIVDFDGTMYLNGKKVTQSELETRLEQIKAAGGGPSDVSVLPDKDVSYDDLEPVMRAVQERGLAKQAIIGGN